MNVRIHPSVPDAWRFLNPAGSGGHQRPGHRHQPYRLVGQQLRRPHTARGPAEEAR